MIGDLFDDGSPSDTNTNTNTNINTSSTDSSVDNKGIHLSSSSSSGLLDFAVPPSSVVQPVNNDHDVQQDVGLVVNEEQPQPQPQQRQTSISLLGFSDSITANNNDNNNEAVESIPTIQHSPSVDLLGSHSPPPIQQQQQQPLDIFNTPVVAVSTTTNVMATKRDSFAPLDSSQQQQDQQSTLSNTVTSTTPTSATDNVDDPFGVFIQPTIPQLQQQLVGKLLLDPLSNISAPSTAPSGSGSGSGSGSIQPTLLSDPLVKETTTYTADKVADKKETSTMTTTANPVVTTKENNMDVSVNEVDDDDHNDNDNNGDDIEIKRQEVETPTKVLPPSTTTTTGMVIPPFEHQNSEEFVSISLLNVDDDHEEEEEEEEMKKQQNKGNSKSNTKTTEKVVEEESFPVLVPVYDRNNNNNNSNISSNKDEEKEYNSEKNDYKDDTPALPLLVSRSGNNDDKKEEQKQESIVVNTNSSTLTSSASASVEKGNPVGRRSSTSVPAVTGRFANFKNLAVGVAGHVQANVQVSQQRFQNVHVPQRFQNVQVSQRFSNVFGINNNKATTSNNDGNPTMAMETITNGNVVNNLSPSTTTATVNVPVTSEAISPSHNGNNDDNNNNNNNAIAESQPANPTVSARSSNSDVSVVDSEGSMSQKETILKPIVVADNKKHGTEKMKNLNRNEDAVVAKKSMNNAPEPGLSSQQQYRLSSSPILHNSAIETSVTEICKTGKDRNDSQNSTYPINIESSSSLSKESDATTTYNRAQKATDSNETDSINNSKEINKTAPEGLKQEDESTVPLNSECAKAMSAMILMPEEMAISESKSKQQTSPASTLKVSIEINESYPSNSNKDTNAIPSSSIDNTTPSPSGTLLLKSTVVAAEPESNSAASTMTNTMQKMSKPLPNDSEKVIMLQKEIHAAHTLIMQLQHHENVQEDRPGDAVMVELQANLQKEMNRRAEAEEKSRVVMVQSQKIGEEYKIFKIDTKDYIDDLTNKYESLIKERGDMEKELIQIRQERDKQGRKEMALTTRLNAAKKKESVKANAAEHYEEQADQLESDIERLQSSIGSLTVDRDQLQEERNQWKMYAEKRTKLLETALNNEKKLNNERKTKMKGFVEAKTEEVRSAKADYLSLETELYQNTHSLKELNHRYKQLHAQWVQSQTRNRELQRDMMKMKKDSEKMHKAGDSLEARLSRSSQQSEDHKNKRIYARNELMSVLGQLESEKAVNSQLQESIKMTFTPKALSQQQTIQEALYDFEGALQKLSTRLSRPLVPYTNDSMMGNNSGSVDNQSLDDGSIGTNSMNGKEDDDEGDGSCRLSSTNRAVQKLENETQRVSQNILAFPAYVERMHDLLDGAGPRNCVDALSSMLLINGGGGGSSGATNSGNTNATRRGSTRVGQRYGQISANMT